MINLLLIVTSAHLEIKRVQSPHFSLLFSISRSFLNLTLFNENLSQFLHKAQLNLHLK